MAQTTYKVYSGSIKIGTITGRNITSAKRKAIKKWGIYVWLRSYYKSLKKYNYVR